MQLCVSHELLALVLAQLEFLWQSRSAQRSCDCRGHKPEGDEWNCCTERDGSVLESCRALAQDYRQEQNAQHTDRPHASPHFASRSRRHCTLYLRRSLPLEQAFFCDEESCERTHDRIGAHCCLVQEKHDSERELLNAYSNVTPNRCV